MKALAILAACALALGCDTTSIRKAGTLLSKLPETQPAAATTNAYTCLCDLSKPRIMPPKSGGKYECSGHLGGEVRFLGWSIEKNDWVFIPSTDPVMLATMLPTGEIEAKCHPEHGIHYRGQTQKSSANPMITNNVVRNAGPTQRVYVEFREVPK